MKFLIQTYNNEIEHDFSFTLLQQIKAHNRFNKDNLITYVLSDKYNSYGKGKKLTYIDGSWIPVGSVEFVLEFMRYHHDIKTIKPINIPKLLATDNYLGREIFYLKNDVNDINIIMNELKAVDKNSLLIKSDSIIKSFNPQSIHIYDEHLGYYLDNFYKKAGDVILGSTSIDIESEWRGFVHKNQLIDIRNYSGTPTVFPDIKVVKQMVRDYQPDAPISYTIDVAIEKYSHSTRLIEVHDFFSCGLYGFDHVKYPWMLSQWYFEFLRKNNISIQSI